MVQLAGGHTWIKYPLKNIADHGQVATIVRNYCQYKADNNIELYLRAISYRLKRPNEASAQEVDGDLINQ